MGSLERAIDAILGRASGQRMNETNTRVLLIEPMLEALGWDTHDLSAVTREFKLFDGSFLDFALMDNEKPRLFVEAKALNSDLSDPKWVSQTINYANNEGVTWCALTDGLRYHVYKTNEPVDMTRKLLFEVDLTEAADPEQRPGIIRRLSFLARESILRGDLDSWGVRLFDDGRVRATLEQLFTDPPSRFVNLIRSLLPDSERQLSPSAVRESLQRVGGRTFLRSEAATVDVPLTVQAAEEKPRRGRKERVYTYEEHFGDKPQAIVDLYSQFHERVVALGDDVERVFRKQYVGYFIGKKSICSVIPQKGRLRLVLPLDPKEHEGDPLARDISGVGHWGVGDMEATLDTEERLDNIMAWVADAAEHARVLS